jgi:hypothetical protein
LAIAFKITGSTAWGSCGFRTRSGGRGTGSFSCIIQRPGKGQAGGLSRFVDQWVRLGLVEEAQSKTEVIKDNSSYQEERSALESRVQPGFAPSRD